MTPDKAPAMRGKRPAIEREEEKAWIRFYQRIGNDPALATEVLVQLDSDAELKRAHLALYLSAKESLLAHKTRHARDLRTAATARWLLRSLLLLPAAALWNAVHQRWRRSREIASVLLEDREEPAIARIHDLQRDADIAAAKAAFLQGSPGPGTPETPRGDIAMVATPARRQASG